VLGPLLFLLFINDLPSVVAPDTMHRLFADDCLLYREIHSQDDQLQLQRDLKSLEDRSILWGMKFNAKKCNIMSISRSETPRKRLYTMDDTVLGEVSCSTYLGVLLTTDITWASHISTCAKKANSRLGFIKRNLKGCTQSLKRTAYISLVRSIMEYSSGLQWFPLTSI